MKPMGKKMKKIVIFLVLMVVFMLGCKAEENTGQLTGTELINEAKPGELKVYVMGDLVRGSVEGESIEFFHTAYTVGPFGPLTNGSKFEGHMLYAPLQSFEKEMGIPLNVQYFYSMELMEKQILEDKKNGDTPDVIIIDYHGWGTGREYDNVYRLIYNGWFADMLPFLDLDKVYESDEYYNEVLEAGLLSGKQYIVPLSFNMNALFASEEDMNQIGVAIEPGMESTQLLEQMEFGCNMAQYDEIIVDSLSTGIWSTAIIQDYWESTGLSVVDYERQEATIDKELFEDMAVFFKQYLKMNIVDEWESVLTNAQSYMAEENWSPYRTPGDLKTLDDQKRWAQMFKEAAMEWLNQGVFYYENSTLSRYKHSLPGQCTALNTLYEDINETMVMVGIPTYNDNEKYMAQVQLYGGVLAESEHPYHSYQLLKHLMDQEYDPYYAIPVQKEKAESVLDQLTSSVYTLYLGLEVYWEEDADFSQEVDTYDLQPLPENLQQQLQYMFDNIGGAALPQPSIYGPIVRHLEAYAFELESLDEAYENACKDLEEHLEYITAGDSMLPF